jgi:predicted alpha/beta-fold hydrolase
MVASPIPIVNNKATGGFPKGSYNKYAVYRMKQVADYYKKKFNRPIWLTGISAGGPRMMGVLVGNEKTRPSDRYAGLIFVSPYVATVYKDQSGRLTGEFKYNIRVSKIKYKMNLPILVINHARDHKAAQHPKKQEWFTKQLAKRNSGVTELKLLTEGDPKITYHDGGNHWFIYNKQEVARVISKFILDNTK